MFYYVTHISSLQGNQEKGPRAIHVYIHIGTYEIHSEQAFQMMTTKYDVIQNFVCKTYLQNLLAKYHNSK